MGNLRSEKEEVLELQERKILEPEAKAFHNTGSAVIHNRTNLTLYVVDGENQYYKGFIDPLGERSFNGVILPWCDNSNEVFNKAFQFYSYLGGTSYVGLFYMFQNWKDDMVYYTPWGNQTLYENKVFAECLPVRI